MENNLLLSIATTTPLAPDAYLALVEDGDSIVACAVRTPPRRAVISRAPAAALESLAGDLADKYPDLSEVLGVMAVWDGMADSEYGLSYPDPRLPALGSRVMVPPHLAAAAAADLGANFTDADDYETHRIALGVPRGGLDFVYGDTFPHEADMDQLNGVDFDKGCYVGQEVVSRVEHRARARGLVVSIAYDEFAPTSGLPIMAGEKQVGTLGSTAKGRGLALMRLDRIADALAAKTTLEAGGVAVRALKPSWAKFDWPGEAKTIS